MTQDDNKDEDLLPDKDAAKEFYAKYEPKEVLGRGISSTVRRCIEKETGVEYAAKIIDVSSCAEIRDCTLEEVRILRVVLGYPYIIQLYDVFESETFIFLVFELCRNGELFDYLTSVVTLSEKKTRQVTNFLIAIDEFILLYIMRQIFEALMHIHAHGIVHRDLKPENILLDDAMNVKITDFGFARILQPGQFLTELCGTPNYLAPEVLKASMYEDAVGYSHAVDLWACGVIMYTLLVGCPPFWHRKQMMMLRNIMEGNYTFESPKWGDITDSPKDLIRKLLIVEPKDRLTVNQALEHPFFHVMLWDQEITPLKKSLSVKSRKLVVIEELAQALRVRPFDAKKKFKFAIMCIRAVVRLGRLKFGPETITVELSKSDPYRHKALRTVIDACAFHVYGHWVKKGEGQNRAALFENVPKVELRHLYMSNISSVS
ncbi:hypothetical protein V9T40_013328 [Parthenolecanium corni]|uniref:phosphorylase kinase n=1 Tax=Parthenolecanium corni TaxID=536013 RepID=A0AAN9TYR8_9HEMI